MADDLARRAIGELVKRVEELELTNKRLIIQQNNTDKCLCDITQAIARLTTIAERLAGVA